MTGKQHVLQQILSVSKLEHGACAAALGFSRRVFEEMLSGQREIPDSTVPLIAAVLGINESLLTSPGRDARNADIVPAIWYKLRANGLTEADREYVLTLRQLAFYQHELEQLTDTRCSVWKAIFDQLRREMDSQTSPTQQGRQAARLFRASTGLGQGAIGIGEVLRGYLRNNGVLVIESAAADSVLEGCSFYVGPSGAVRPAIFANSYRTTWFRRNRILMHELAHAIFDVESAIAALDRYSDDAPIDAALAPNTLSHGLEYAVQEQRADAFAQEVLVPREVLRHVGERHRVRWDSIDTLKLAEMVSATHVEQRLLVKALLDEEFVDAEGAAKLAGLNIADELRSSSLHALSTKEFLKTAAVDDGIVKRRTTTTAPRKILLPARYVAAVLAAFASELVSRGKAARMLMIDEYEFSDRFATEQLTYAD